MIVMDGVHKRFGKVHALRGLDLTVPAGAICGVLGPNGAGKTTAMRVLATLLKPDAGTASVAGFDVVRQAGQVRRSIGLAGQHAAVDARLTGRENLLMFARLHHLGERAARSRADELLARFDLTGAADRLVGKYSGGMRRRLDVVASLITSPPVLFLDEPTTGLDPQSRNAIWDSVRDLTAAGTTVLLTTQYLDEADQLADDIVVIDAGQVIASGTPDELKAQIGARLDVVVAQPSALATAAAVLADLVGGASSSEPGQRLVSAPVAAGAVSLTEVVRALDAAGVVAEDVALRRPTLDEVFLRLTERETERSHS
jgi:ABC-2 type transport system ATP-binding protein